MIKYSDLGLHKQLNEVVFAGSHDAGINTGGKNAKTQDLDIHDQAVAGVRLFDIRITGAKVQGTGNVVLQSYHGKGPEFKHKLNDKSGPNPAVTRGKVDVDVKAMVAGEFGMTLYKILDDASRFVTVTQPGEFLILKFDHCSNWELIARSCIERIGGCLLKGYVNLNVATLRLLAGKVIVTFSNSGIKSLAGKYGAPDGIYTIRNLKSGGAYDASQTGMTYFGKGGTSPFKPFKKIEQNVKNQRKLMKKGAHTHPEVMGMMYWTTTGMSESIKERNDTMWTKVKVRELKELWNEGLYESIQERIGSAMNNGSAYARGGLLKAFMPNVVMVDFADAEKCRTIYGLNRAAAVDLADVATVLQL